MMIGLNIKDDLKRKPVLLLHYAGEEINDIFETLPDTREEKNYQAAIDALNAHFPPLGQFGILDLLFWSSQTAAE